MPEVPLLAVETQKGPGVIVTCSELVGKIESDNMLASKIFK